MEVGCAPSGRDSPEGAAADTDTHGQTPAVGAAAAHTGNNQSQGTVDKLAETGNAPSDTGNTSSDTLKTLSGSVDTFGDIGNTSGDAGKQASTDPGKNIVKAMEGQTIDKKNATTEHDITEADGKTKQATEEHTGNGDNVSIDKDMQDLLSKDGLTSDERNTLFAKAISIDQAGQKNNALKCYLKCLVGLKEDSKFSLLPQCLRNIGDIYYGKDEFEKAISFIQAEKLYYENVLIDDTELQKQIDESGLDGDGESEPSLTALRATEYEHLAKLCLDEKQPQLALEYAGKATKLRREVYGDDHPLVVESLDFFTTVYAEVGKHQYSESLSKYEKAEPVDPLQEDQTLDSSGDPVSILRKRKNTEGEKVEEKHVRFDDSHAPSSGVSPAEENCARAVLIVLLLVCVFFLAVLCLYVYCHWYPSDWCDDFKQDVHYAVMRVRYWFYHYVTNTDTVKAV